MNTLTSHPLGEHLPAFQQLANGLSPENLTCDGEVSPSQVASRKAALMIEWRKLETKLGRKVMEEEVWLAGSADMPGNKPASLSFTKESFAKFRVDFEAAVQTLGKAYGLEITLGSISYGDTEFHSKMTARRVDATTGAAQLSKEDKLFLELCHSDILKLAGSGPFVGSRWRLRDGKTMEVAGVNRKAPKYPFEVILAGKRCRINAMYFFGASRI